MVYVYIGKYISRLNHVITSYYLICYHGNYIGMAYNFYHVKWRTRQNTFQHISPSSFHHEILKRMLQIRELLLQINNEIFKEMCIICLCDILDAVNAPWYSLIFQLYHGALLEIQSFVFF